LMGDAGGTRRHLASVLTHGVTGTSGSATLPICTRLFDF